MKLGIVSDEIARDFATAVRVGVSLGLRRYQIRDLTAGRASPVRRGGAVRLGAHGARGGVRMKLGIVSDEIARDFATAVRVGISLGLRRYQIRNLTAGRAPMWGEVALYGSTRTGRAGQSA